MRPRNGARWSNSQASRWIRDFAGKLISFSVVPAKPTGRANARPMTGSARAGTLAPRRLFSGALVDGFRAITRSCGYGSPLSRGRRWVPLRHTSAFPRRDPRPSDARFALEMREGARNAGCFGHTRSLVCETKKHTSKVTTGIAGSTGIPCASGFNGFLRALSGDRAFLSPSPAGSPAGLTSASRCLLFV